MKRVLNIVSICVGVVLGLLIVMLLIFPGHMVKTAVNTVGPSALGVDVRLDDADFSLLSGQVKLKGLFIGNPEGFNAPSLCEIDSMRVKLDLSTVMSDTLVIEEVFIEQPVFTYQKGLTTSNLSKLLKNMERKDSVKEKEEPEGEKAEGKKVIINKLTIEGAMVNVSVRGIPVGAPIPLPPLYLKDIGKDSGGTKIKDAVAAIFKAVFGSIKGVVAASLNITKKGGEAVIKGAKGAAGATGGAAKAAGEGVVDAVKGVGNLIKGED